MREFLSTYRVYIRTFFKARAQYKMSFIMGMASNFYCYFITYVSYWVLANGTGTIAGWDFSDLSILYGLSLITYSVSGTLIWYTAYHLEELIISGQLDIMLIRPQGLIRQMIFQRFGDTFLGQILVTVIFLGGAFAAQMQKLQGASGTGGGLSTAYMILYLILAVIGGVFLQTGSMILFGAVSFWTMKSGELIQVVFYDLRDMTKYPLAIYPKAIQRLLTFVLPWAFINYYPAMLLTGKSEGAWELAAALMAPLVGAAWFLLAVLVFRLGIRRYTGAGS